ncbi:hypothetical protein [Lacipirellula sp.]|uniref:hypothetical protein n=1 Tax=Lacipirellula sp. TaxID=2691419 RepID=UPI003D0CACCC
MKRRRAHTEAFSLFSFQDIITSVTGVIILVTLLLAVELIKRPPIQAVESQDAANQELQTQIAGLDVELESLNQMVQENTAFLHESASLSLSDLEQTRNELARRVQDAEHSAETTSKSLKESIARSAAAKSEMSKIETASLSQLQADNAALATEIEAIKASNHVVYNQVHGSRKVAWIVDLQSARIRVLKPGDAGVEQDFSEPSEAERVRSFLAWARTINRQDNFFVLLVRPESIGIYQAVYEKTNELKYDLGFDLLGSDTEVKVVFPSRRSSP